MTEDAELANVTADMEEYLLIERAMCACEALCICGWDNQ